MFDRGLGVARRVASAWLILLGIGLPISATTLSYSGANSQSFTVAASGMYSIVAFGASGGNENFNFGYAGGPGAEIGGLFALTAGSVLHIYVGEAGGPGYFDGGGGGGTFVVGPSGAPMLVAGGGGGGGSSINGQSGKSGALNSNGGAAGLVSGGGGGWSSSGGSAGPLLAGGGGGFPSLAGGRAATAGTTGGSGGFGGGGGSGNGAGGGGGGYSGGDAGDVFAGAGGDGGGSFDGGWNEIAIAGANWGNGLVEIMQVATPVPEPGSLALLGFGGAVWAVVRRSLRGRRQRV